MNETKDTIKNRKKFLKAYKQLCLEHGFEIRGCGECGSAWLQPIQKQALKHKKLVWKNGLDSFEEIHFAGDYDMSDDSEFKKNRI